MAVAVSRSATPVNTDPERAEQIYVTHCTKEDSLRNDAEFTIRASSTGMLDLHRAALPPAIGGLIPAYELPMDMRNLELLPVHAPRRLALVKVPGGQVALAHSSYLPRDTLNRRHSYFTHVLFYPSLPLRAALQTWGSPEWQTEYAPKAPKKLEHFEGLPKDGLLNDDVLKAFLSDSGSPSPSQNLATVLYPDRAQGDATRRRQWLRAALQGCLLALDAGAGARNRLYIRAEPGLVALLLYGTARLLPSQLIENLTFSTYEPSNHALREYTAARVIGTYTRDAMHGLESDYFHRCGYGVDTIQDQFSPELREGETARVDRLVGLAAAGAWPLVDRLQELWSKAPPSPGANLSDAVEFLEVIESLKQGEPSPDRFVGLTRTALGRTLLQTPEYKQQIWPSVYRFGSRPDVRQAFAGLFQEHLEELMERAAQSLAADPSPEWRRHWELVKGVVPAGEAARRFADLVKRVEPKGNSQLAPDKRNELLLEWHTLEPNRASLPREFAWLLTVNDPAGFRDPVWFKLPRRWLGQALWQALASPGTRAEAVATLKTSDAPLLRGFCEVVNEAPEPDQVSQLGDLVAEAPEGFLLFDRLQKAGLRLPPKALGELLTRAGAAEPAWDQYWTGNDGRNLLDVLARVEPDGEFAGRLWESYLTHIDRRFLVGDGHQLKWWNFLQKIRSGLGGRVPRRVEQVLEEWEMLANYLKGAPSESTPEELQRACKHRGLGPPEQALRHYFECLMRDQGGRKLPGDQLKAFLQTLRGFFADDRSALRAWTAITKEPRSQFPGYLLAFFQQFIAPPQWVQFARYNVNPDDIPVIEKAAQGFAEVDDSEPAGRRKVADSGDGVVAEVWAVAKQLRWVAACLAAFLLGFMIALWIRRPASPPTAEGQANEMTPAKLGDVSAYEKRIQKLDEDLRKERGERTKIAQSLEQANQKKQDSEARLVQLTNSQNQWEEKKQRGQEWFRRRYLPDAIRLAESHVRNEDLESARKLLHEDVEKARELFALPELPLDSYPWEYHCLLRLCDEDKGASAGKTKSNPWTLGTSQNIGAVAFSAAGPYLAMAGDNYVKVWDLEKPKEIFRSNALTKRVTFLALSPDGRHLAAASGDPTVQLWDLGKPSPDHKPLDLPHPDVQSLAFRDNEHLVSASVSAKKATIKLWELNNKDKPKEKPQDLPEDVICLTLSLDGKLLAVTTVKEELEVWETPKPGSTVAPANRTKQWHSGGQITGLVFSPDGKHLASASRDRGIKIWDVNASSSYKHIPRKSGGSSNGLAFSPNGQRLATVSNDHRVELWDASEGAKETGAGQSQLVLQLPLCYTQGTKLLSVAFSPDGEFLATGTDNGVVIWRGRATPAHEGVQPPPSPGNP